MTKQELDEQVDLNVLSTYFKKSMGIFERWMKVMCQEEGDIVSTLIVDQLFKSILIKLDQVFVTNSEQVSGHKKRCDEEIESMKNLFAEKIDRM